MPLARTRPPVRPTVRLRPVPPLDPPFDDEYVPETWVGRPAVADPTEPAVRADRWPSDAEFPAPIRVPRPAAASTIRARSSAPPGDLGPGPATAPPRPTGPRRVPRQAGGLPEERSAGPSTPSGGPPAPGGFADATPEAILAAGRFLGTCLEIVNGYRPARHVRSLVSPIDAADIIEQLDSATTRISGHRRPGQPARTARLRRLRVCEPRPGVVEAAAVVGVAGRTWAVAFRLERRRGSWVGVSVQLL